MDEPALRRPHLAGPRGPEHARSVGYRLVADAVMLAHFGFLGFLTAGGFLAWRWPRVLAAHVPTVAWGLLSVTVGLTCPLTVAEERMRLRAGQEGLPDGFIDTYLTGVVYPEEHTRTVQLLAAGAVAVSWVGCALRHRRRRSTGTAPRRPTVATTGRG